MPVKKVKVKKAVDKFQTLKQLVRRVERLDKQIQENMPEIIIKAELDLCYAAIMELRKAYNLAD